MARSILVRRLRLFLQLKSVRVALALLFVSMLCTLTLSFMSYLDGGRRWVGEEDMADVDAVLEGMRRTDVGAPSERTHFCMVQTEDETIWVIGGDTRSALPDGRDVSQVYKYKKKNGWTNLTRYVHGKSAPYIKRGACAYNPNDKLIYLYGGMRFNDKDANDLYTFHTLTETWGLLTGLNKPEYGRSSHSMEVTDDRLFIFGGSRYSKRETRKLLNDVTVYDIKKNTWSVVLRKGDSPWPGVRFAHSSALLKEKGQILVYGGFTWKHNDGTMDMTELQDTWLYSTLRGIWEPLGSGPTARGYSAMAPLPDGHGALLHGGVPADLDEPFDDLYEFDGATWRSLQFYFSWVQGFKPLARTGHSMAVSNDGMIMRVFAGVTGGYVNREARNTMWIFHLWSAYRHITIIMAIICMVVSMCFCGCLCIRFQYLIKGSLRRSRISAALARRFPMAEYQQVTPSYER